MRADANLTVSPVNANVAGKRSASLRQPLAQDAIQIAKHQINTKKRNAPSTTRKANPLAVMTSFYSHAERVLATPGLWNLVVADQFAGPEKVVRAVP